MTRTLHRIKNRHDLIVVVELLSPINPIGLAIIQHGVTGFKEQTHLQKMGEVFFNNHYNVVHIDSTHSFGQSDGEMIKFTATTHAEDFEDVVAWCSTQDLHHEKLIVCGHSMGGFSALRYACLYPDRVKAVAPISTTTSGYLLDQAYMLRDEVKHKKWREEGKALKNDNGKTDYLSWNFFEDFFQYDLLNDVDKINVPVVLIVGENDPSTPLQHQMLLLDKLDCPKELHVVKNAAHSYLEEAERIEMGNYLDQWIKNI